METSAQKFDRLLNAFEALVGEETGLIEAADYASVGELQQRIQPVIDSLVALTPESASPRAREKVQTLIEHRQRNIDTLNARLAATRDELDSLQRNVRQAARIVPAYGRAAGGPGPSQLRGRG